ncbi:MAG: hypothetical protein R2706_07475 [Acidimicrobiales bacterium]
MAINKPTSSLGRFAPIGRVVAAGLAAIVVFVFLLAMQSQTRDSASVIVALDEDQVEWPYHDAVRQTATGAIRTSPEALAAASAAAAPGTINDIETSMRDGQSYFDVTVEASDNAAAARAVDALVAWASDANMAERTTPFDDEATRLNAEIATLQAAYDDLQGQDGSLPSARAVETASLIAQFERRLVEVEMDRATLLPQFRPVEPAMPDTNSLRPILSALGAFVAALAVLTLLESPKP